MKIIILFFCISMDVYAMPLMQEQELYERFKAMSGREVYFHKEMNDKNPMDWFAESVKVKTYSELSGELDLMEPKAAKRQRWVSERMAAKIRIEDRRKVLDCDLIAKQEDKDTCIVNRR